MKIVKIDIGSGFYLQSISYFVTFEKRNFLLYKEEEVLSFILLIFLIDILVIFLPDYLIKLLEYYYIIHGYREFKRSHICVKERSYMYIKRADCLYASPLSAYPCGNSIHLVFGSCIMMMIDLFHHSIAPSHSHKVPSHAMATPAAWSCLQPCLLFFCWLFQSNPKYLPE